MEKNSSYYPETKMKMKHLSAILDNSAHFKIAELILVRYKICDVYTQNSLKKISELIIHVLIKHLHYNQVPTTYLSIKSHVWRIS